MPQPTSAQLGTAIREIRLARGWSVEHLAGEAGVHWTTLSRIENGHLNPTWNFVVTLATALEVDMAELARRASRQPMADASP